MKKIQKNEITDVQSPTNQIFYRALAALMTFMCLGDQTWWGYEAYGKFFKLNRFIVAYFGPVCTISQVLFLYLNYNQLTADALAIIYCMLPVTTLVNIKVRLAKRDVYRKLMMDFMTKIHLHNYKGEQFVNDTIKNVERYTRQSAYCLIGIVAFDSLLWCIVPVVNNLIHGEAIKNRTMQTQACLYVWAPFDYRYDFYNWLIVHVIINVYAVAHGCGILGVFDVIFYIIVFHLIGHIKVLKHKVKTQFDGDLNDEEVKKRLVNVIEYHSFIIKFFKDLEAAFGINVSGNYLNNLIADSLLLYNLMIVAQDKGTVIIYCVMTIVCMAELVVMSFILEEVRIQSDDLPEVIYSMPWENWSVRNKKMLVLVLLRIQPELAFVAAGGLRAGVRPMTSIIKSTFSYYVMLKTSIE